MKTTYRFALGSIAALALALPARADCTGDARKQLLEDAKPTLTAKSYRGHIVTTLGGRTVTRDVEYVAPNRVHMSGGTSEMVSIGSQTWMKMNGAWRAMPVAVGSMVESMRDPANFDGLMTSTHTKIGYAGTGTWNGKPAHLYCTTSTYAGVTSSGMFYVGPDHYIYHVFTKSSRSSTTADYRDFNTPISIKAPA